jgi:TRAP-type uncharacterized transport system substrate-binding protein
VIRILTGALLACLITPVSLSVFAQEGAQPDIVISTGLEGGGYWNAGNRLQAAASGAGLSIETQRSTGSLSNLRELVKPEGPVSLAFTQADALQYFLNGKPDATGAIEKLESIGEECVFVISGSKSDIKTDKDMQEAKRLQLGIKSPNSGIRVTFDHMASLVPELRNATVHYGDTVELINDLVHPRSNISKAVMVVQKPGAHSAEIDMVVSNPDKYRFVKLSDDRLTLPGPGGEPAYRRDKVKPSAVPGAGAVETVCVEGLLVANTNKLSAGQRSRLSKVIGEHWSQIREGDE